MIYKKMKYQENSVTIATSIVNKLVFISFIWNIFLCSFK